MQFINGLNMLKMDWFNQHLTKVIYISSHLLCHFVIYYTLQSTLFINDMSETRCNHSTNFMVMYNFSWRHPFYFISFGNAGWSSILQRVTYAIFLKFLHHMQMQLIYYVGYLTQGESQTWAISHSHPYPTLPNLSYLGNPAQNPESVKKIIEKVILRN